MKKLLIVVDMQNDFIDGSLGTKEAQAIVPKVVEKIKGYKAAGDDVVFTLDTHYEDYMNTLEGKNLPVRQNQKLSSQTFFLQIHLCPSEASSRPFP